MNDVVWVICCDCVPLVGFAPDHPPLAEQLTALVVDHVRVAELPAVTLVGVAESETIAAGGGGVVVTVTWTDCGADAPPVPVQTKV
jgi:hypothetical protein